MARYCDRGACARPAAWRVKRFQPTSGGQTTDAYCEDCASALMTDKKIPAEKFERIALPAEDKR